MKQLFTCFGIALSMTACATDSPQAILAKSGYSVQTPATTLHGPGTIVSENRLPGRHVNTVSLSYICSSSAIKLPADLQSSGSEGIGIGSNKVFSFSPDGLEQIGLKTSAQYTRKVTLKFENTQVQEYSTQDLGEIRSSVSKSCNKYIAMEQKAKNAFQVQAVFIADISYSVEYNANVTADTKAVVIKELQGALGLKLSGTSEGSGKGLIYGVMLKPI